MSYLTRAVNCGAILVAAGLSTACLDDLGCEARLSCLGRNGDASGQAGTSDAGGSARADANASGEDESSSAVSSLPLTAEADSSVGSPASNGSDSGEPVRETLDGGLLPVDATTAAGGDAAAAASTQTVRGDAETGDGLDAGEAAVDLPTGTPTPPVTNGQYADLVLGQPDFATFEVGGGPAKFGMAGGLGSDGQHLWVPDLSNGRVLQFNAQPIFNQPNADLVIGQASLSQYEEPVIGPDALHLVASDDIYEISAQADVHSDGRVLAVVDGANRVLLWNRLPTANGVPWDIVLGQTTATGQQTGLGRSRLNRPQAVWTDGERVLVADTNNHRVLIWLTFPTTNDQPADLVLGQTSFEVSEAPDPPTPSSMNSPADVFFDGQRLYVVDRFNHRIMVWNGMPTTNNAAADYFVGQTGGSTGNVNAGAGSAGRENAVGVSYPSKIAVAAHSLFVSDPGNRRVLVYSPVPTATGQPASAVLGAADLVGTELSDLDQQIVSPRSVAVFGDKLYVADTYDVVFKSRVLRYQLSVEP